jgi:hypothetical protein
MTVVHRHYGEHRTAFDDCQDAHCGPLPAAAVALQSAATCAGFWHCELQKVWRSWQLVSGGGPPSFGVGGGGGGGTSHPLRGVAVPFVHVNCVPPTHALSPQPITRWSPFWSIVHVQSVLDVHDHATPVATMAASPTTKAPIRRLTT